MFASRQATGPDQPWHIPERKWPCSEFEVSRCAFKEVPARRMINSGPCKLRRRFNPVEPESRVMGVTRASRQRASYWMAVVTASPETAMSLLAHRTNRLCIPVYRSWAIGSPCRESSMQLCCTLQGTPSQPNPFQISQFVHGVPAGSGGVDEMRYLHL